MLPNVKLVVCGDDRVGKTSLLHSYTRGDVDRVPTVFDNYSANLEIDKQPIVLGLWDTSGQNQYDRLRLLSYQSTDVFFLCFSLADLASFVHIKSRWGPELNFHCPDVPIMLIGAKCDLRDDPEMINGLNESGSALIKYEQGIQMAREIGAVGYMETSAWTNVGLREAFDESARVGLNQRYGIGRPMPPKIEYPPQITFSEQDRNDFYLHDFPDVQFNFDTERLFANKYLLSICSPYFKRYFVDGKESDYFISDSKLTPRECTEITVEEGSISKTKLRAYFQDLYLFREITKPHPMFKRTVTSEHEFGRMVGKLGRNKGPFSDITVYLRSSTDQLHSIMLKQYDVFSQILDQVEEEDGNKVIHWEAIGRSEFEMIIQRVYLDREDNMSYSNAIEKIRSFSNINLPFMAENMYRYIGQNIHKFDLYEIYWTNQELEHPTLGEVIDREMRMNYLLMKNEDEFQNLPNEYKAWLQTNYHPGDDYMEQMLSYEKALQKWNPREGWYKRASKKDCVIQ